MSDWLYELLEQVDSMMQEVGLQRSERLVVASDMNGHIRNDTIEQNMRTTWRSWNRSDE